MLYHHTVVTKEWCNVAQEFLFRTTLSWCHSIEMRGKTHQCKQRKQSDCLMFIHSYYVSHIHGHIIISKDIFLIFPATVLSIFFQKKCCRMIIVTLKAWTVCNVSFVNERQQITWSHAQNAVSLRVLYKFVNSNSTLVICLRFDFIEMFNKLITYIVSLLCVGTTLFKRSRL